MPVVIVPTPIGNMGDITLRALDTLRAADVIACEDTRRTSKLLARYDIRRPLVTYHRHNERARAEELARRAASGELVAIVSDAGTPCLSDPGCEAVSASIAAGAELDALPGASALLPALSLSGLPARPFSFFGFAGESVSSRRRTFVEAASLAHTTVFYTAPHDLLRDIDEALPIFGDRRASAARELTKAHQEVVRGRLSEIRAIFAERAPRGEFVLVIAGRELDAADDSEWPREADRMRACGMTDRDIADEIAARYSVPRNRVKRYLVDLKEGMIDGKR